MTANEEKPKYEFRKILHVNDTKELVRFSLMLLDFMEKHRSDNNEYISRFHMYFQPSLVVFNSTDLVLEWSYLNQGVNK